MPRPSLNKINLIGNVGAKPEIRALPSGAEILTFGLATDDGYIGKDGAWVEHTNWHNINVIGKAVPAIANTLAKGSYVFLEGQVEYQRWKAKDGTPKERTIVKTFAVKHLNTAPKAEPEPEPEPADDEPPF